MRPLLHIFLVVNGLVGCSACDQPSEGLADAGTGSDIGDILDRACTPDLSHLDEHFEPLPNRTSPIDPNAIPRREGVGVVTYVEMNRDRSTSVSYWRDGEEPVELDAYWIRGTEPSGEFTLSLSFFVNGASAVVRGAGGDGQVLTFVTTDGRANGRIEIPAAAFVPGLNTVHMVEHWRYNDHDYRPMTQVSKVFNVFSEIESASLGVLNAPSVFAVAGRVIDGRGSYLYTDDPNSVVRLVMSGDDSTTVAIQSGPGLVECDGVIDRVAVVALVDGQPAALNESLDSVYTSLQSTYSRHDYSISMPRVPQGSYVHLLALAGIGMPLEDRHGQATQWWSSAGLASGPIVAVMP